MQPNDYYCLPSVQKKQQQRLNIINRKWNQIKIPKNKRYAHTQSDRQNLSSLFCWWIQTYKQFENHSPVHAQKLKAFVCCVFVMAKRSFLPLLLHAQWLPALRSVVRYCSKNNCNHTITSASSHNTQIANKLYESTRIFIFISISVVKITLRIPRTEFSITSAMCSNNHGMPAIFLLLVCFPSLLVRGTRTTYRNITSRFA